MIALTVASCCSGQQLTPSLIEFLDLTATQITRLRQNAAEFNKFHGEKSQRYEQVTRELAEETAREVLNPMALGQRYIEQEAICRELRVAHEQNFNKNVTVLTDAQKAKLKTLDAVSASARLASSAQGVNLIEGGVPSFVSFADFLLGGAGTSVGGALAIPGSPGASRSLCGISTVQANPIFWGNAKGAK